MITTTMKRHHHLLLMVVVLISVGLLPPTTSSSVNPTPQDENSRQSVAVVSSSSSSSSLDNNNPNSWQRLLPGDDENNDEGNDNNNNDNDDDGNKGFFGNFKDRVFGDMKSMWDTSPSSWITEYWEVFVGLSIVTFLVLACHCYICCDICFFGKSSHDVQNGRIVKTQAEFDEQRKKKQELGEPILGAGNVDADGFPLTNEVSPNRVPESDIIPPEGENAVIIMETQTRGPTTEEASPEMPKMDIEQPQQPQQQNSSAAETGDTGNDTNQEKKRRGKQKGKRKIDLASEVVSVWSEFLTQGFSGTFVDTDEEEEHRYQKYREEKKKARRKRQTTSPRELV